ncbi:MAG: 16S rRNA (adenine(1518)-N(6)/adenine(1519)-N(6))-dimethyltransferase RsmA [Chitinophagaceae bacterium]
MEYTLKKSLGQHFLHDEQVIKQIIDAIVQLNQTQIVEVGPGGGALTKHLLSISSIQLKAIEFDQEKVAYLQKQYPNYASVFLQQDFLKAIPPFADSFAVVGNFPYNISSQILFKILDWKEQVPFVVGMFQKEVAERVAASPNSKAYGVISVLIQAFYSVTYLFDVPAHCFNPPPKVVSGVILLERRKDTLPIQSHKKFVLLVKTAFGQRRKMLRNPLKPYFTAEKLQHPLFNKRAEQLSLNDFVALSNEMN